MGRNKNIATGSARVGTQAGNVTVGNVDASGRPIWPGGWHDDGCMGRRDGSCRCVREAR